MSSYASNSIEIDETLFILLKQIDFKKIWWIRYNLFYVLNSLNGIGAATSNMFVASLQNAPTGCANSGGSCLQSSGGGINQTQNQGVTINALTKSLVGKSNTARLKVGSIRMRFNRPVNNPILQVSGLGATAGTGLGHSAEVTYTGTGSGASIPVTFRRIAGNANFAVIPSGSNGVGSQFNNIATTIDSSSASGGGASGSVYVQGKGITELNFDIYIRGEEEGRILLLAMTLFSSVCPVWMLIATSL
jgi:hypothetical protein